MNDFNAYEADGIRIEWVELGEGYYGDFDPTDPEDVELLRFDVKTLQTEVIDGAVNEDWVDVEDGSYCTQVPVSTPNEKRLEILKTIHGRLSNPPTKKEMQAASWIKE